MAAIRGVMVSPVATMQRIGAGGRGNALLSVLYALVFSIGQRQWAVVVSGVNSSDSGNDGGAAQ